VHARLHPSECLGVPSNHSNRAPTLFTLQFTTLYPQAEGLSWLGWLGFGLPLGILVLVMAWALLWLFFLRGAATLYDVAEMGTSLRREYLAL
jgi:di/tricarboxylate transporter